MLKRCGENEVEDRRIWDAICSLVATFPEQQDHEGLPLPDELAEMNVRGG